MLFRSLCVVATCICLVVAQQGPLADLNVFGYNPVADPSNQAITSDGTARFTVLTPNLVRMEYSAQKTFEDRATLTFVNRRMPQVKFTTTTPGDGFFYLNTSAVTIKYKVGNDFNGATLTITGPNFNTYQYGTKDSLNLRGTIRSLDVIGPLTLDCDSISNMTIHDESLHCAYGLISRSGYAVVEDQSNYIMDSQQWFATTLKNRATRDVYFFGHGSNYKQALRDYVQVAGKIAMIPRGLIGVWWSRWYDLNNIDVRQMVYEYKARAIPLDVYVLDMDWHSKQDWGGYSWDKQLFPYPSDTIDFLHSQGLLTSGNIHDDTGMNTYEDTFQQFCSVYKQCPATGGVAFQPLDATYMRAVDDTALQSAGFDVWWIDWQQGGTPGGCPGDALNPTVITNHVRATDHARRGSNKRDAVLARWGGLGGHRYQVGFSGDVLWMGWDTLAYQPYFSYTASNVGFGFWSHDIVGPYVNPELYVRWIQWGAMSGTMRSHDRGMANGNCAYDNNCPYIRPWDVAGLYFEANRFALQTRATLYPYIYRQHRVAFTDGVSLIRPMYYEFPNAQYAYAGTMQGNFSQYFFGDDIIVAPVVVASDATTKLATFTMWLPQGVWYDEVFGEVITVTKNGGQLKNLTYSILEIPRWVRGGAIIPKLRVEVGNTLGMAAKPFNSLQLWIYPGASTGSTWLYEDDGVSLDYLQGKYAITQISYTRSASGITVTINPPNGTYNGMSLSKDFTIVLVNGQTLTSASVNGQSLPFQRFGAQGSWWYEGSKFQTNVWTPVMDVSKPIQIVLTFPSVAPPDVAFSGLFGLASRATQCKRLVDEANIAPGTTSVGPGYLKNMSSLPDALGVVATNPQAFTNIVLALPALFKEAAGEINQNGALFQMYSDARKDTILCGSVDCINSQTNYVTLNVEGYQPAATDPNAIKLYDYWNNQSDNWVDISSTAPQGYTAAIFKNGYVLKTQLPGTVPLQLWYLASTNDHMTLASAASLQWAQSRGYKLLNGALGYVYSSAQDHPSTGNTLIDQCIGLLGSAQPYN